MSEGVNTLTGLLSAGDVVVLSGAGISTESGIPDYRGPSGSLRRHTPMTYQVFVGDPAARRRYWARSHVGWRMMTEATPNDGHRAVAHLQRRGPEYPDRWKGLHRPTSKGKDNERPR